MTFLSACGLSSTGADGGALCASASVMIAAGILHVHSGAPPSCSSHNFSSSYSFWGFAAVGVFCVTLLPPCGSSGSGGIGPEALTKPKSHFLPSPHSNALFTLACTCPVWSLHLRYIPFVAFNRLILVHIDFDYFFFIFCQFVSFFLFPGTVQPDRLGPGWDLMMGIIFILILKE